MKAETIHFHMFQFVSILFLIYFLYKAYSNSIVDALEDTLTTGIISKLLDSGIEYIVNRKPIQHLLPMIVASTLLIGVYYYQVHQMMKIE